MKNPHSTK